MSKRGKLARESSHSRLVDETLNDITNLRNQYPHTRSRSRMAFEEDLLNSTNEQSSITTNETPNKLKKVQLNQSISDLMVEIEYQKIIDECFVGRFIFPVINTTETRQQYQFRQIDTSHLNDLKLQFLDNVIGKNFRSDIIINIYPKNESNRQECQSYITELKNNHNEELFYSSEIKDNFLFEVIDGIHSVEAIKSIASDSKISNEIKELIGIKKQFEFMCKFYYNLGMFILFYLIINYSYNLFFF